jgi:hypothetical protein
MAAWPLVYACAEALAVAESTAVLSHFPAITAIAAATFMVGYASIVPATYAETVGHTTMPPTVMRTVEKAVIALRCLIIRDWNVLVGPSGASATTAR